ncbi:MAG: hypothetical protein ABFR47_08290 [Verrucomicrobiota bacterium]
MKKYLFSMFTLCFFVWAVVVDNVLLPSEDQLRQDVGAYTRYRVKEWQKGGKLDIIPNELMIYAVVKNREQLYYMEHKTYFENALKNLPEGTPVQLRYVRRFPKLWKRHIYDLREAGIPIIRYSSAQLHQKQEEIWKFSGIMGGIFLALAVVGWIGKPRRK